MQLTFERRFADERVIPILHQWLAQELDHIAQLGGWDYVADGWPGDPRETIGVLLASRAFRTGEIDVKVTIPDHHRRPLLESQIGAIILRHLYRGDPALAATWFRRLDPEQRLAFVTRDNVVPEFANDLTHPTWAYYTTFYGLPPGDQAKLVGLIAALDDGPEKAQLLASWLHKSISRPSLLDPSPE